ncbi:hypothetical protein [Halostella sp. PRR32]|uniref:hypothetical protein n=1 Tax=Halostella sp. PRR32 TaxID=3098147 RepID=UPI002B1E0472|nr:hypothetical protein [Halostella sp. PRR32]
MRVNRRSPLDSPDDAREARSDGSAIGITFTSALQIALVTFGIIFFSVGIVLSVSGPSIGALYGGATADNETMSSSAKTTEQSQPTTSSSETTDEEFNITIGDDDEDAENGSDNETDGLNETEETTDEEFNITIGDDDTDAENRSDNETDGLNETEETNETDGLNETEETNESNETVDINDTTLNATIRLNETSDTLPH